MPCGITYERIIGPYFFESENGASTTVTGASYRKCIQKFSMAEIFNGGKMVQHHIQQGNRFNFSKHCSQIHCLTGPLHGQPFAHACRPLTNHRAAWRLSTFGEALRLVNGQQAQVKHCSCRGPVSNLDRLRGYTFFNVTVNYAIFLV